jgi:hypothetical protein
MALAIDPRVAWQTIDGQAILMDLAQGHVLGLNPVGTLVWTLLPDLEEDAIAREVARQFDVEAARASHDVRGFLDVLRERRLVIERG